MSQEKHETPKKTEKKAKKMSLSRLNFLAKEHHTDDTLFCHDNKTRKILVTALASCLIVIVLLGVVVGGAFLISNTYKNRVIPGLSLGDRIIAGMSQGELKNFLVQNTNTFIDNGIAVTYTTPEGENRSTTIFPIIVTENSSVEMLDLDLDAEVARLINYGKGSTFLQTAAGVIAGMAKDTTVSLEHLQVDDALLQEQFVSLLSQYEREPKDAYITISSVEPLEYSVHDEQIGSVYNYAHMVEQVRASWYQLKVPQIKAEQMQKQPQINSGDIRLVTDDLADALITTTLKLVHTGQENISSKEWIISRNQIAQWITVTKNAENKPVFVLDYHTVSAYLTEDIAPVVSVNPVNARFQIEEGGKVSEFEGSQEGYTLNTDATIANISDAYQKIYQKDPVATSTVMLVIDTISPVVSTADVNQLGISEVLGVGISNFGGSPQNRIRNIKNAVNKLNGLLIGPGEEFSTIEHTKPYTIAGGYLPELVIKGDEIKPEIGGGLCQVGTTLFRMAMNSGMKITERRNHSLVVNYYNDLSNGLPGTDATIYEPAPDFKFLNDTQNYILIETKIDLNKQQLVFTIWGTNDGRDGSYNAPTVHRWIGHGPTKIVETTKLAPGARQCQHAYTGAETSFTYTRKMPDGTVEEEVFTSYYRPLPQICLVGVDATSGSI